MREKCSRIADSMAFASKSPTAIDGHEIGAIPVAIELDREFGLEVFEVLLRPDGKAHGVFRAVEHHGELLVLHARFGAQARAPLLDHDAALLLDLPGVEGHVVRPVLEDVEASGHDARRVGGHGELYTVSSNDV